MSLARSDPAAAIGYLDSVPSELRATLDQRRRRGLCAERRARGGELDRAVSRRARLRRRGRRRSPAAPRSTIPRQRRGCSTRSTSAEAPDAPQSAQRDRRALGAAGPPRGRGLGARVADDDARRGGRRRRRGAMGRRATRPARAAGRSGLPTGATRDAALVRKSSAQPPERPAVDPRCSTRSRAQRRSRRGVNEAVRMIAQRDAAAARQLADQYLTDPGARQAAERFIEQSSERRRVRADPAAVAAGALSRPLRARWAPRARTRYHRRTRLHSGERSWRAVRLRSVCAGLRRRSRAPRSLNPRAMPSKLLRAVAAAPVTDAMLRDPDPARLAHVQPHLRRAALQPARARSIATTSARSRSRGRSRCRPGQLEIIPLVLSRRHVSDDAGQPRRRQPRRRARRHDRRDVVGVRAAEHGVVAHQGARDLRRHDLLHGARRRAASRTPSSRSMPRRVPCAGKRR